MPNLHHQESPGVKYIKLPAYAMRDECAQKADGCPWTISFRLSWRRAHSTSRKFCSCRESEKWDFQSGICTSAQDCVTANLLCVYLPTDVLMSATSRIQKISLHEPLYERENQNWELLYTSIDDNFRTELIKQSPCYMNKYLRIIYFVGFWCSFYGFGGYYTSRSIFCEDTFVSLTVS